MKWLIDQSKELGLSNVTVIRARAEEVVGTIAKHDQVTARAVSAFSKLIPLCAPLAVPGGELVLMKGKNAEAEIAAAEKAIRKFSLSNVRVEELGIGVLSESTRVIRATTKSSR